MKIFRNLFIEARFSEKVSENLNVHVKKNPDDFQSTITPYLWGDTASLRASTQTFQYWVDEETQQIVSRDRVYRFRVERARFFVAHSISACGVERLTQQAGAVNFVYPYDRDIGSNGFCMWQIKPDTAGILELSFSNLRTYDTLFIYENAPETGRLLRKIVPQSSDTSRLRVLTGHCWVVAKGHFAPNNNWDTLSWRVNWRVIHPVIWIRARSQSLDLGTVTGTDPYQSGSMVTVRALQKPGCGFVHWLDELNQTVVSTNQNYTFQATEPKQLMAVFTANCTMTTLNSDVGNFESNGEYSTPQWCSWLITSPNQYKVNLNFRYLNLIDNKHFMYIYDGDSLTGQLLGRYTGNNWNLSFTGYSGKLFIRMVANEDTTSEQHGWSAHWHCDTAAHCIVRLDVKPAGTGNVSFSGVSSSSEYAFQRNQVAGISTASYQYLEFK